MGDREILRDLHGVSEFGNLTSAQRAKDPYAMLRLLSTASGTLSRGKRNFNLSDGDITKTINEFFKDGVWDIPALKALYQPLETDDGGGKEDNTSGTGTSTSDDVDVNGDDTADNNQQDMELEHQQSGVPLSGNGTPLTQVNAASASANLDSSRTTVALTTIENATVASTDREESRH